jgi:hypothetical protein
MEDSSRPKLLILRPDLYTGYLLVVAIIITAIEFGIVALVPRVGQTVLALGWIALVVAAFQRLWSVKITHQLTGKMQIYRVLVAIIAITIISYLAYFSFISAPQAMLLPLSVIARFLVLQNMMAAINSAIIAALGICVIDEIREFIDRPL